MKSIITKNEKKTFQYNVKIYIQTRDSPVTDDNESSCIIIVIVIIAHQLVQ